MKDTTQTTPVRDSHDLAKRKTYLQARLQAIVMSNVYGKTLDQLTEVELDKMNTIKELNEVNGEINRYTGTT